MSRIEDALTRAGRPPAPPPGGAEPPPWNFERVAPPPPPPLEAGAGQLLSRLADPLLDKVVISSRIPSASLEQFRRLGATLHHAQTQKGTRVLMVASAQPGEGKTLTATNLALTLSESYRRRVLLIDADLRRPTLHELFALPNVAGLSEGLNSDTEQKLTITPISPMLSLLAAGAPNPDPMSALTSGRMRTVIDEARETFEWVIIDTPPVTLITDAALLAAMVDGIVLVVQAAATPYTLVRRTIDAVGRGRIVGVVLNRAAEPAPRASYYASYLAHSQSGRGLARG